MEQFDQLDDLQLNGWQIWQNSQFFRFGTDGVLLADFAQCKKGEKYIDLCTGTCPDSGSLVAASIDPTYCLNF